MGVLLNSSRSSREAAISLVIGLFVGILAGLTGVGGGALIVPLLVAFLGLTQHKAHGTSLATVIFSAAASAIPYAWQQHLDVRLALELAIGSVIGAILGGQVMPYIPATQLRRAFGLFLGLLALRLLLPIPANAILKAADPFSMLAWNICLGLIIGFIGGILGVGGGAMIVPATIFLWGASQHIAQGTSLVAIVPTGIAGSISHHLKGNMVWRLVPFLAFGFIIGALVSASFANTLDTLTLRTIFALFLIVMSIQMIARAGRK